MMNDHKFIVSFNLQYKRIITIVVIIVRTPCVSKQNDNICIRKNMCSAVNLIHALRSGRLIARGYINQLAIG